MAWSPTRAIDHWSESVWVDYLAAVGIVGLHFMVVRVASAELPYFTWPSLAQRLGVYSTGATVVAIIGGLSALAISVYLAAGGPRARAVRRNYNASLRRNWRSLLVGMGIAAALCLLAQALDRPTDVPLAWFLFELGMSVAGARFVRLVWLFNEVMRIADRDLTDLPRDPAPEVDKAWTSRAAG